MEEEFGVATKMTFPPSQRVSTSSVYLNASPNSDPSPHLIPVCCFKHQQLRRGGKPFHLHAKLEHGQNCQIVVLYIL